MQEHRSTVAPLLAYDLAVDVIVSIGDMPSPMPGDKSESTGGLWILFFDMREDYRLDAVKFCHDVVCDTQSSLLSDYRLST